MLMIGVTPRLIGLSFTREGERIEVGQHTLPAEVGERVVVRAGIRRIAMIEAKQSYSRHGKKKGREIKLGIVADPLWRVGRIEKPDRGDRS